MRLQPGVLPRVFKDVLPGRPTAIPSWLTCPRLVSLPALGIILLACLLATQSHTQSLVFANGTIQVVKKERAGPYELQVGMSPGTPRVGNLHVSLVVKDVELGKPITNATVMVMARGPEGGTDLGPLQAANNLESPQFYDADLLLDTEGSWMLILDIESDLGAASLELPLEVTKANGVSVALVATVAIAFLALSVLIWGRISRRGKSRTKMASGGR